MTCLLCGTIRMARGDAIYCSKKCAVKAGNLRLNYGLSAEGYRKMLDEQDNACAVCKVSFATARIFVDHCHRTGNVRGLLCSQCNVALGMLGEEPKRIRALAQYAEVHSTPVVASL